MTRSPLTPWLAAIAIVLAYIGIAALDGPTAHSTEVAQAQALDDAHRAAQYRQRFERAAARACGGENAAWSELEGGAIQCRTKHGRKTIVANITNRSQP